MTDKNTKFRSLVLAALMVFSVFAGTVALTGSAAAATGDSVTWNGSTSIGPNVDNQQVNSSATVNLGADTREIDTITVDLGPADLSAVGSNDVRINYNDSAESYPGPFTTFSKNNGKLTLELSNSIKVGNSKRLTILINDTTSPIQTGTYTARTKLVTTSDSTADSWDTNYKVSTTGGTGDTDPPIEGPYSAHPRDWWDADAAFANGTVFQGQTLYLATNDSRANGYELHKAQLDSDGNVIGSGDFVRTLDLKPAASPPAPDYMNATTIDTSGLSGKYVVQDGSGALVHADGNKGNVTSAGGSNYTRFNVVKQTFDATWQADNVPKGSSEDVNVQSNRGSYMVTVSSSGLSDSKLADIFGGDASSALDGVQIQVSSTDEDISGDFTGISQGDYTFKFEVVDTGVTASDTISVGAAASAKANFADRTHIQQRGDIETFTLNLDNTDTAALVVGSSDVNYKTTVSLEDTDDDGQVIVSMNTYWAGRATQSNEQTKVGNGGKVWEEGDGTKILGIKRSTSQLQDPLEAAEYPLSSQVASTEKDVGTLVLSDRSTSSAATWTAPGSESFGDALGSATMDSTTAHEDYAIVQFKASGLYGYVNNSSGSADDGYLGNGVFLYAQQQGVNQQGDRININDPNVDLQTYPNNDTMYMLIDTQDLSTGTYEAHLKINETNPYIATSDDKEELTTTFKIVDRTASFDTNTDGEVIVRSASDQMVTGTTNIAPNTEIDVQARTGGTDAFLKTQTATVADDGSFNATFDFSNVESNTTFTFSVPNQDFTDDAATPGRVQPAPQATVNIEDQTTAGDSVTVASASLSDGGFVVIHDSTLVSDGATFDSIRGHSDYLDAGSHSNIEVSLDEPLTSDATVYAMPHLDTNGNQQDDFVSSNGSEDGPYTMNGSAVTDSADVTIQTATATPTATATATATATPTATATATEPPSTATPTTTQPGFGVIVSVLALLGAALIALRRRD